jgi:hypothetical protein
MHISWKRITLSFGIPLLLLAGLAPTAYASTSRSASGTFDITISPTGSRVDDGNTIISFTFLHETFTGTLTGTRDGSGTLVVHPDGTLSARTSGLFTGTIGGASGTATFSDTAAGVASSIAGRFRTSEGSGALENVTVSGSLKGHATSAVSFAGTYAGKVRSTDE